MRTIENAPEYLIFNSRESLAPFYLGFGGRHLHAAADIRAGILPRRGEHTGGAESEIILAVLTLVDITIVAISVIERLKGFRQYLRAGNPLDPRRLDPGAGKQLARKVVIHVVLIAAGEMFVPMDRIAGHGRDRDAR
jgi:uncharacterized membrane protein YqhA